MLYKIGLSSELVSLESVLPGAVIDSLRVNLEVLDAEYGAERNYLQVGGYALIAENREDIQQMFKTIPRGKPSEWVELVGEDQRYVSALYLLNDDFAVLVYFPAALAPDDFTI